MASCQFSKAALLAEISHITQIEKISFMVSRKILSNIQTARHLVETPKNTSVNTSKINRLV